VLFIDDKYMFFCKDEILQIATGIGGPAQRQQLSFICEFIGGLRKDEASG